MPTQAADFANPAKDCDIIMKGGVTSGVVYPNAILELAKAYRFRSIGGTSAGGIAAAFAAAAEYARRRGDPGGFTRLEERCLTLPDRLPHLFQPRQQLKPLMTLGRALVGGKAWPFALLQSLPATALLGVFAGLVLASEEGPLATVLAALVGLAVAVIARLAFLLRALSRSAFGLCSGLTVDPGQGLALTDWLHEALQYIAHGKAAPGQPPLTFGDLRKATDGDGHGIDLRMMTTNLSLVRPHALPNLPAGLMYDPTAWTDLMPAPVLTHLASASKPSKHAGLAFAPAEDDLPVLLAVRMSLSFPLLISAVPMAIEDIGAAKRAELRGADTTPPVRTVWLTDGGLTSNFPIHFFDALLPNRPTFALSLDALPPDEPAPPSRVSLPQNANDGIFLPIRPINGLGDLFSALFGAAKDWQDNALSVMGGQRERIVRVALAADEGGLNLDMPQERALRLMGYGAEAGRILRDQFDFDEHRWRRGLVAYQQLEITLAALDTTWTGGFQAWFHGYRIHPKSYRARGFLARGEAIETRLDGLATCAGHFRPPLRATVGAFPKPEGRMRIMPDL